MKKVFIKVFRWYGFNVTIKYEQIMMISFVNDKNLVKSPSIYKKSVERRTPENIRNVSISTPFIL